jgi:hypothetical protein
MHCRVLSRTLQDRPVLMNPLLLMEFNRLVIEWARAQFAEELRTHFQRMQLFDAPRTMELVNVMRSQPAENVEILAQVLPLGVFWEIPEAQQQRIRLPLVARRAVERLRSDYDMVYKKHWGQHVQRIALGNDVRVQREFRLAVRDVNALIRKLGARWNFRAEAAGQGEWGLIREKEWGRSTISLNLDRTLTVFYRISIRDNELRAIRFSDDYLSVLGLGSVGWTVENAGECIGKFIKAGEFALWHLSTNASRAHW